MIRGAIAAARRRVSAAVAWRSSSAAPNYPGGSATSITLTKPTGAAENDILVAILHIEDGTAKGITVPTGWTLLCSLSAGSALTGYVLWKRATSSEPTTYAFSWSGTAPVTGNIHAFSGATTSGSPWGGYGQNIDFVSTIASVSYTTSGPGLGVWLHSSYNDSSTIGPPSGYTQRGSTTVYGSIAVADRNDATAGAKTTGAGTTSSGSNQRYTFAGTLLL